MSIPDWVDKAKKIIKDKGLKQEDLIDALGVTTQSGVSHYFTGKYPLDIEQLVKLSKSLNTDPNTLLDFEVETDSTQIKSILNTIIEEWLVRFNQMGWAEYTSDPAAMRDLIADDIMKQLFNQKDDKMTSLIKKTVAN
ncbi:helix-turn-helix transcriptional regulator [Thalassomonas sp. RHCl1]|uniref:helix-turn-helix domain-containing protein n=1 Tax=Thalassomonas sp. RHCl1 TaxID=2995320 RepID=UPI00248D381A|nr:helix-turn-helix transcriptional regulator [Thalassomonas sp. RHCl1]